MKPVSLEIVQLIVIGLLRSLNLARICYDKVSPAHFREEGFEKGYRVLYEIAQLHFKTYQTLITRPVLITEFERFCATTPSYLTEAHALEANKLIEFAWGADYDNVDTNGSWEYIRDRVGEFLLERHAYQPLRDIIQSGNAVSAEIMETMQRRYQEARLTTKEADVNPFDALTDEPSLKREKTGAQWLDLILDGGFYEKGGEIVGFLAGPGWGKTGAAVHLAVSMAIKGYDTLYFAYEQPVRGSEIAKALLYRVISCGTGIPRHRFDGGLSGLLPHERVAFEDARRKLGPKLHFFDMSGYNPHAGYNGMKELESYLVEGARNNWKSRLVIIDWFGLMISKYMGRLGDAQLRAFNRRMFTEEAMNQALVLGSKFGVNFFILQQISTDAIKRGPGGTPLSCDAQDAKNFDQLLQVVINMSKPSKEGLSVFNTTKCRSGPPKQFIVKRDGSTDIIRVTQSVVSDPRQEGRFVRSEDSVSDMSDETSDAVKLNSDAGF